jgi:hypothetical protein
MTAVDGKVALSFSTPSAIAWTIASCALLAAAGFWPTYSLGGMIAVQSMLTAGVIVAVVGSVAVALVGLSAPGGAGKLSLAFIFSGMAKALACAVGGLAAGLLLPLSVKALLLWLVLFYCTIVTVQIVWLVKVLRSKCR